MMYSKDSLGLDAADAAVAAVHLQRRWWRLRLRAGGWARLPADAAERRRVQQAFMQRHGWEHVPGVLPLRGSVVMLHALALADEDPRSVEQVVAMELKQFGGLDRAQLITDHVVQRGPDGRRLIMLAVARREEVQDLVDTYRALGVDPTDVVPAAVALMNTVDYLGGAGPGPYVCVALEADGTEVVVAFRRTLLFARRFGAGSAGFPDRGRGPGGAVRGADMGWLEADPAVTRWLGELKACLQLYAAQWDAPPCRPLTLVLCGAGADTPGLPQAVRNATQLRAVPLSALGRPFGLEDTERYALATGLALAGGGRSVTPLSLLPAPLRERLVLQWHGKYGWRVSAATLLALLILVLATYVDVKRKEQTLLMRRAELSNCHSQQARVGSLQTRRDGMARALVPYRTAVRNSELARAVLLAVGQAKHPDDWVTLIADARSYFPPPRRPVALNTNGQAQVEAAPDFSQVVVEGYTPVQDLSTVKAMIAALRARPGVAGVDLLGDDRVRLDSARDARWSAAPCRLFAVEIVLQKP